MTKQRLDREMVARTLVSSRSQAESWIKLGKVSVDGTIITKIDFFVHSGAKILLEATEKYVSRAGLKLASVVQLLGVSFDDKTVLDVGSSTGGFTDYSLQHGARKVIAVDVGTNQLHPSLRDDARIELHEKTDIRDVSMRGGGGSVEINEYPDIIVIDVSFISLREVLPHVATLAGGSTKVLAMVKPQFEADSSQVNKGIIKNDAIRRKILQDFESWVKSLFVIADKRDSEVAGSKGNRERFYVLQLVNNRGK